MGSAVASGACTGAPCPLSNRHCRSKWGWCGSSSAYCNSDSIWTSACASPAPTSTTSGFLSATPTTSTTSIVQVDTTSMQVDTTSTTTVSNSNGGTWTTWDEAGVTCHTTNEYEVETICATGHDMMHACDDAWVANESPCQDDFNCQQTQIFQSSSALLNFCTRTD